MKLFSWLLSAAFLTACCAALSDHDDKSSILRQPIEKVNSNKRRNVSNLNTLPIKSPTMVDHALEAEDSQPLAVVGFITKNGNIYELADDTSNNEERQSRSSNSEAENENEQPHICNYGSIVIYSDLPCEQVSNVNVKRFAAKPGFEQVGQQQTAAEENTNSEDTQFEENVYNENRRRASIKRSRRKRKQKRRYKNDAKRPMKRPSKKRKRRPTNFELNEFNRSNQQRPTKGYKMKNGHRRPQNSNKNGNSNRNKNKFSLIKLQHDDDYYYDDDYEDEFEDDDDNDDFENFFRNQRPNQRKRPLKMYAKNYDDY